MVVFSRLIHHRPVFHADRTHTYHQLVAWGLDPGRAVLAIQLTTLVLCFVAFIALSFPPLQATLTFCGVVLLGMLLLVFLALKNPRTEE
jgi:hypothetical protein